MKIQYSAPNISITVDCVIFGLENNQLKILLIKRSTEPEKGRWALPGGFVEIDETLEDAAGRILHDITGLDKVHLEQICAFSSPDRHPMGRIITIPFYTLVKPENYTLQPKQFANEAYWSEIDKLPRLAFDHEEIVAAAVANLKKEIRMKPIGFELLPEKFTISQLQKLYEILLNEKLDRRNFRRKILNLGILEELNEVKAGRHKDAKLYRFDTKAYGDLKKSGFQLL